ncbi:hypothetical protein [Jannaschia aquimarina]|uniref:Uncharacterized protein n=1 Tax=Jannaschia aquimarina TaxID=935700 RepID=A0A0D1EMB3_9RHOB|nr:hypothetical protein [Jannaschia aquimarina]KIT16810.1 hypothetical protein jaqu_13050 [Jannaschia aquimarina]SNT13754.1 hypothetical protein SAMN05421775_106142 [Jannaschia aquimarina]
MPATTQVPVATFPDAFKERFDLSDARPAPRDLVEELIRLYESRAVQRIAFELEHVRVTPEGFRQVALRLALGEIAVVINSEAIAIRNPGSEPDDVLAMYVSEDRFNAMIFHDDMDLTTIPQKRRAVHEGVHAMHDIWGRQTAIFHEEGAAYIAGAWFEQEIGYVGNHTGSQKIADYLAREMRSRITAGGRIVEGTADEINAARFIAHMRGYDMDFYNWDGVPKNPAARRIAGMD